MKPKNVTIDLTKIPQLRKWVVENAICDSDFEYLPRNEWVVGPKESAKRVIREVIAEEKLVHKHMGLVITESLKDEFSYLKGLV